MIRIIIIIARRTHEKDCQQRPLGKPARGKEPDPSASRVSTPPEKSSTSTFLLNSAGLPGVRVSGQV
jgi:hypothetical protein